VGWRVSLPEGYRIADSAAHAKDIERGKELIEKSSNTKVDPTKSIELFTATGSGNEQFSATITPFNAARDGNYQTANQRLKEEICNAFLKQVPNSTVDTASSELTIDGLRFGKFRIAISANGNFIMNMFLLSKYYKGYNFSITYLCQNDKTKETIESTLRASTFVK
jgi:hypothetical protein